MSNSNESVEREADDGSVTTNLLKTLVRNRGSIKSRFTRFAKYLCKVDEQVTLSDVARIELNERVNKFRANFDEFEQVQSKIENCVQDADLEHEYEIRDEIESTYYDLLSKAEAKASAGIACSTHSVPPDQDQGSVRTNNDYAPDIGIKLPTIELIKFDGRYETWLEFKEVFESMIHNNDSISEVHKFHYLRASLVSDAAQVIKSIDFSGKNYSLAWQLLVDRYDNTRLLVHNHIREIVEQPNISKDNYSQIRSCIDVTSKNIRALKNLGECADNWDTLLIYLLCNKLEKPLLRDWEAERKNVSSPTLESFLDFLRGRADLLETWANKNIQQKGFSFKQHKVNVAASLKCNFCKENHLIYKCEKFTKLSVDERIARVGNLNLCGNCLCTGHDAESCRRFKCKKCSQKHNVLLHKDNVNVVTAANVGDGPVGVLATACIRVVSGRGEIFLARALLDCGSQTSIITQSFARKLKLDCVDANASIVGIGSLESKVDKKCVVDFLAAHTTKRFSIECLLTKSITSCVPTSKINLEKACFPTNLALADSSFDVPAQVDILLGASIFWDLLNPSRIPISESLYLQDTKLGWIVVGHLPDELSARLCNLVTTSQLDRRLGMFWEIENVPAEKLVTPDEKLCENIFVETVRHDRDGRFVVTIPLKDSCDKLGESRSIAVKRFMSLERKLSARPQYRDDYVGFMRDYLRQGHMSLVSSTDRGEGYYMPHHGVEKVDSLTTKLRVVFNASSPTLGSKLSFNDIQLVGPTIQEDLFSIIVRFRQHQFVVCADIEGMYRQIWVNPNQRKFQKIVWRESVDDELRDYQLNTVTYGTASAPYLAIRCLIQLGLDCEEKFPDVARIIKSDFYVDDLVTGADSIEQLSSSVCVLRGVLEQAGFRLRKWRTNCRKEMSDFGEMAESCYDFGSGSSSKMLGIRWDDRKDVFVFRINDTPSIKSLTKRIILAEISTIFDPLGLLGAATVTLKIFMQQLWLTKVSWDDIIPDTLGGKWLSLRAQLTDLNNIEVPRCVSCQSPQRVELHGFADASQSAYGCCIYLRTVRPNGEVSVSLVCSKSRVAPIKQQSIPRLELCAAHLLADLMESTMSAFRVTIHSKFYWSDSTIVIQWLNSVPTKLETFVANRVSKIQSLSNACDWKHVRTNDNPADWISRGIEAITLLHGNMWWYGPPWLSLPRDKWPVSNVEIRADIPGLRKVKMQAVLSVLWVKRFSSLRKLQRTTAYVLRFISNCKREKSHRQIGLPSVQELESALTALIRISQRESFEIELKKLANNTPIKSKIRSLAPYIDDEGIIRVGGRLKNVDMPTETKNPILLSSKSILGKLYFEHEHLKLLHAAPQALLYSVRQRFWPLGGRRLARTVVHKCIKCFRFKADNVIPVMGNLPEARVRPSMPFTHVGVDFAGPVQLRDRMGRGGKVYKAYICLFICFASKAIHLETVTSLSSDAFIAAFRRFCSRRGKPLHVYSDNGTNFTGAWRELGKFIKDNADIIGREVSADNVTWHFIPPRSPHFGGLWERGVRSVKHHLRRVIGNLAVTYEHFTTVLTQIEAILNSRPLTQMSADPHDFEVLTPAHFLIGKPMTAAPDPNILEIKENRRSLFQRLQAIQQHFWTRWSKEYVTGLQERQKWQRPYQTLTKDTLVLIKEDLSSPLQWKLGRIVNVVCGSDGVGRVADIKTSSGIIRRSFAKICPLPLE